MVDRVAWPPGSIAKTFIQGVINMSNALSVRIRNRTGSIRACGRLVGIATASLIAVGIVLLASTGSARADIHANLVVHLRFDGDVTDATGRGNNGTIVRAGTDSPYVPGIIGMAFQTQGTVPIPEYPTGNYITLGSPDDLNFGTSTDFSLSWWGQYATANQTDNAPWFGNKDANNGSNRGWVISSQPNGMVNWTYRERSLGSASPPTPVGTGNGSLDDGKWHHYVVTFARGTGGMGTIYLDGDVADTTPINSDNTLGDISFVFPTNIFQDGVGNYTNVPNSGNANFAKAAIDDLGVWRRAITPDEVTLIYTMGMQGKSALD
jgi:hypothetical protein